MICDIFHDPGDKAWCFTKVLPDVMERNVPLESKVIKNPQMPYMNYKLRKAMHKWSMFRNIYIKWTGGVGCRQGATECHDINL